MAFKAKPYSAECFHLRISMVMAYLASEPPVPESRLLVGGKHASKAGWGTGRSVLYRTLLCGGTISPLCFVTSAAQCSHTQGLRRIFCNTTTVTLVPMHPGLTRCETTRRIWMRRQLFTKHRGSWCRASIWGVCVGILPTQSFLGLARTCVLHSCGTLSLCLHSVGEVVSLLLPGHSFLLSVWFRLNSQSCRTWRLASMDAWRACTVVTCIL